MVVLICQSFYLLYHALNRGQNESYKKTKYFGNSVTEFSFPYLIYQT